MRRRRRLTRILDSYEILPFDLEAAEYYGALADLIRTAGRDPRPRRMDLQIAATAARHGLTLVTRNGSDFAGLESALLIAEV